MLLNLSLLTLTNNEYCIIACNIPFLFSIPNDEYTLFSVNLLDGVKYIDVVAIQILIGFITSFFTGLGIYTVITIFVSLYQLGSDRSKLSLISFSDDRFDQYFELDKSTSKLYDELSLIKFTSNIQEIETYLFNLTFRIIIYLVASSILFAVWNVANHIIFLALFFTIFSIFASFLPQIKIHSILSSVKASTLEILEDLLETSRKTIYGRILTKQEQGEPIEDIYSKMKFLKVQIDETKELITWAYDFPSMLKLIGGAIISIALFTINIMLN